MILRHTTRQLRILFSLDENRKMLTLLGDLLMAFLETYIRTRIVGNHNPFLWLLLLNETANKLGDLFQKEKKNSRNNACTCGYSTWTCHVVRPDGGGFKQGRGVLCALGHIFFNLRPCLFQIGPHTGLPTH
jgi:hypothetical protein